MALELIDIELLDDHPDNPRVAYREDVVDAIAANLNGEYPQKHALHVRPVVGKYEIIAGHHRKRAAAKAGLKKVWCWVDEIDDEQAFMELATSNNQGELSPLEIGIHALRAIPKAQGKKGEGIASYAIRLGKAKSTISEYRTAAEVITTCSVDRTGFLDKAQHLAAIHKLPPDSWPAVCNWMADSSASVKDVQERVASALGFSDAKIAKQWRDLFMPETACIVAVFTDRLRVSQLEQLADIASRVADAIDDDLKEEWCDWLQMHACNEAWDIRLVQDKRIEFETRQWQRDNADKPDEAAAVSVLLADPPWEYDHATQNRAIENQYPTASADEIARHLELPWAPKIAEDCVLFMWTTAPKLREAFTVLDGWDFTYKTHAIWDKERIGMGYWFRSQHELLLVATRGNPPTPEESKRLASIFREKRDNKHSKKPKCVYEAIESMFPNAVKFEMYQREPRSGWLGGGNEA